MWHYLKSHYWSNRAYADYDALEKAAMNAWRIAVLDEQLVRISRPPHLAEIKPLRRRRERQPGGVTPGGIHDADDCADDIDLILIMSVNPGFGGQSFIDSALRKVEQARRRIERSGRDIRLEVDGGIKADNIRRVADAGADTFVAGSAIFGQNDYGAVIHQMRAALAA